MVKCKYHMLYARAIPYLPFFIINLDLLKGIDLRKHATVLTIHCL
jgi:hypothetical protein